MPLDPILVIDSEPNIRTTVAGTLEDNGYAVVSVGKADDVMEQFPDGKFSMVIADAASGDSGESMVSRVKTLAPRTPVIVTTASGSVNHAVAVMQAGASDYIPKPFSSDTLTAAVQRVYSAAGQKGQHMDQPDEESSGGPVKQMIAGDPKTLKILVLAGNIAPSRATVLIQGESGTGKEVLASYIHHNSGRRRQPFVAVNCAALPDSLAESELFGHEKGAFTGAFCCKSGKFELAHGGTILLDEIGEMALPLQAKLLRVLQENEVDRIGGRKPVAIDTRVIAVTNINLQKAVEAGKFREDLYYRINVVPITLPPLRERREDIPLLAQYFLDKYSHMNSSPIRRIADATLDLLMKCPFKGNVRELENIIERAVLLGSGESLLPEHLMLEMMPGAPKPDLPIKAGMSVKEMEKKLIFHTLKEVADNRTHAAELLGISIRTLRNKLNEYKESA